MNARIDQNPKNIFPNSIQHNVQINPLQSTALPTITISEACKRYMDALRGQFIQGTERIHGGRVSMSSLPRLVIVI